MQNLNLYAGIWLLRVFNRKKAVNPRYSLRSFARQAGIPSGRMSQYLNGARPVSRQMGERIAENLKLSSEELASLLKAIEIDRENLAGGERIQLKSNLDYFDGSWIGEGQIKYFGEERIRCNSVVAVWSRGSSILDIDEEGKVSRFLITSEKDPTDPNFFVHTVTSNGITWRATGYCEGNYYQSVTVTPDDMKFIQTSYLLSKEHYVLIGTKLNPEDRIIVNYRRTMRRVV